MYSSIWLVILVFFTITGIDFNSNLIYFPFITFFFHTLTDYFTSRVVSRLFAEKKLGTSIPNLGAFSVIGFDQVLHYIQLFLTFYFLTNV